MADPKTATTAEILDFYRNEVDKRFANVPDDELVEFIGQYQPEFRQAQDFERSYARVRNAKLASERKETEAKRNEFDWGKAGLRTMLGIEAGEWSVAQQLGGFLESPARFIMPGLPMAYGIAGKALSDVSTRKIKELGEAGVWVGGGKAAAGAEMLAQAGVASMPSFVSAFFGGLPVAAATGGMQSFGANYAQVYRDLIGKGRSEGEAVSKATAVATISGVATAGLTRMFGGVEKFLGKVGSGEISRATGRAVLKDVFKSAGLEIPEEGLDNLINETADKLISNPEKKWGDIFQNTLASAAIGGTLGVLVGGTTAGISMAGRGGGELTPTEEAITAIARINELNQRSTPPPIPQEGPKPPPLPPPQGSFISESRIARQADAAVQDIRAQAGVIPAEKSGFATSSFGEPFSAERMVASGLSLSAGAVAEQNETLKPAATTEDVLGRPSETAQITAPTETAPPAMSVEDEARAELDSELERLDAEARARNMTFSEEPPKQPAPSPAPPQTPTSPSSETTPAQPEALPAQAEGTGTVAPAPAAPPVATEPAAAGRSAAAPGPAPKQTGKKPRVAGKKSERTPEQEQELASLRAQMQPIYQALLKANTEFGGSSPQVNELTDRARQIARRMIELDTGKPPDAASKQLEESERVTGRANQILREMTPLRQKLARLIGEIETLPAEQTEKTHPQQIAELEGKIDKLETELKELVGPEAAEGSQDLGIVPPYVRAIMNALGMSPTARSPVSFRSGAPYGLADLQDYSVATRLFSQPFGFEAVRGIGKLFGGALRARLPVDPSILTYYGEAYGVARAIAGQFAERINGLFKPFTFDNQGRVTNIGPVPVPQADAFSKLMVDPNAFPTTPEQQAALAEVKKILDRVRELSIQHGVLDVMQAKEEYFPRNVISDPEGEKPGHGGMGNLTIAGDPFYARSRTFQSEQEGLDKHYVFEPDPAKRLTSLVERMYVSMAAKRLADSIEPYGKPSGRVAADVRAAYTGTMPDSQVDQIVSATLSKGTINHPLFFGKVFDPEIADRLNEEFGKREGVWMRRIRKANDAVKFVRLGYDLGAPFIQGLPTLFRNPVAWGRAYGWMLKSLTDPGALGKYILANPDNVVAVEELTQLGSTVGRLPEYLAGAKEGLLEKVPGTKPFSRSFSAFLDVAKIELWKAVRGRVGNEEAFEMVRVLESSLLSSRMESIGVSRNQALFERAVLLAPSFYRGALNQVAAAINAQGAAKVEAVKSLGSYLAGMNATFAALGTAAVGLGYMTWDELWERFNPASGSYLTIDIPNPLNGRVLQVGFGGVTRSLIRLLGKLFTNPPSNLLTFKSNPLVQWYNAHAAPIPGLFTTITGGREFMGDESTLGTVAKSMLPLAIGAWFDDEGALGAALSFTGIMTFPESVWRQKQGDLETAAMNGFGKSYNDLNLGDLRKVNDRVGKMPVHANRERISSERDAAEKASIRRRKELLGNMSGDILGMLDRTGLRSSFSGYEPRLTLGGVGISLSPAMRERLDQLMIQSHNEILGRLSGSIERAPAESQRAYLQAVQDAARERAWGLWKTEQNAKGRSNAER